ncbi:MAG: SAM-dependent methyltransferase [Myxococcota bacterium]|jgi:SAM-dependent methyltransferase
MAEPSPAELYEKLHVGNPGDLVFYREQCSGAASILELGCGYGRVLEAISGADRRVVGLDLDSDLLDLARKRVAPLASHDINLVIGDMRSFSLDAKFERILIPYSAIYCLLTDDDVVACLRCIAEHLAPGGRVVLDAYSADGFHREGHDDKADVVDDDDDDDDNNEAEMYEEDDGEVGTIVHGAREYRVTERSIWSRDEQLLDVVYVHEPLAGGHSIATQIHHRYLLSEQFGPLLAEAGLELTTIAGDYRGAKPDDDSDLIVVTATHAPT